MLRWDKKVRRLKGLKERIINYKLQKYKEKEDDKNSKKLV
jgi:hypothetical protein